MIVYEHDPDVVRWGLHTLIDCTLPNSGSYNSITRYQTDSSQVGYVSEGYDEPVSESNVENDAVIARAFQEELSRVAAFESSGLRNPVQESVVSQDWLGRSTRYHDSEHGNNQNDQRFVGDHSKSKIDADACGKEQPVEPSKEKKEESVEVPISVSSPSSEETSVGMEELSHFLDITDESAIDGEMGKRLHQMVPVPHVPKINGVIPSEDEEISDHQRLLDRLDLYELVENKVQGDGNCQFRALSDQLYRSPEYHKFVREQVVNQLKSYPQMYEGYVPMAYSTYLKNMSKTGEWGDHVTLQAAADTYGVKIFVLTSFKDTCYIEILPHVEKSKRVIFLSFWAEVHYNSIYPKGELPLVETKKKKRWWILGN